MLLLRIETHKAQNPKTQKLGLITHKVKNTKETERGPRGDRNTCKVAVSETRKRIRPQVETVKKEDMGNAEWRNSIGETKVVDEKSKAELLNGEPVPVEQVSGKGDNTARGGVTKSFSMARGGVKKLTSKLSGIHQLNLSRYK